jgi:acyl carrier protein
MSNKKIIKNIKNQLNIKIDIEEKTQLKKLKEWDSLGHLTFIAIADNDYKTKITGDDLIKCEKVADIIELLKKK